MLFNLRGPNGSGKSHIVHHILHAHGDDHTFLQDPTNEEVCATVQPKLNALFAGMYAPDLFNTGGCDWYIAGNGGSKKTVDDLEDLLERLHKFFPTKSILFEGFMVSGTFQRWCDFAKRMQRPGGTDKAPETLHGCIFLCLDTPVEVCYDRIISRRLKVGNDKPFNGDNLKALHRQCKRNYQHLRNAGCAVIDVPYETAPEFVHNILKEYATVGSGY